MMSYTTAGKLQIRWTWLAMRILTLTSLSSVGEDYNFENGPLFMEHYDDQNGWYR